MHLPASLRRPSFAAALALLALQSFSAGAQAPGRTRLLRQPSVGERNIAFAYANNIWVVGRDGGDAKRLTSFQGSTGNPELSPDGNWIAFTGTYGGNADVYLVPVAGGEPVRLTWHPANDQVQGWTADGSAIVFSSPRSAAPSGNAQTFWKISRNGGMPEQLGIPRALLTPASGAAATAPPIPRRD